MPEIYPEAMTTDSLTTSYSQLSRQEQKDRHSRQPDAVQLDHLYLSHRDELKAFLMANSRSVELVEVILQDIYLRLAAIPDLSIINNPSAYLNRLANNLLIDHYRRQERNQQRMLQQPVEEMALAEPGPSPTEQIHYDQLLEAYQQVLSTLPGPVQQVIRLYHVDGLTHQEIARKLGKSTSWVEKTIKQALLHCRAKMGDINY